MLNNQQVNIFPSHERNEHFGWNNLNIINFTERIYIYVGKEE